VKQGMVEHMNTLRKQLSFQEAPLVISRLRKKGKKIVQCHGTFDLLHPGHVIHFEEAKALGDVLVVTITGEKFVNKGPGRPFFNDHLRVKAISSLEFVDYVVVCPYPAAVEAIECVKPDIYCKGTEYQKEAADVTGNFGDDLATVKRLGGEVRYVGSIVFSSTTLLNRHFEVYAPGVKAFCKQLSSKYSPDQFRRMVDDFKSLKVLVIGDIIFDKYTTLSFQGLTSKNRIISGRYLDEEMQAGGALAVFRHVREFTPNVKIVSLIGKEGWVEPLLRRHIHPNEDEVLRIPNFTSVVKQRFVEPLKAGKELWKLFSVNFIDATHPGIAVQKELCRRLKQLIRDYDLILVADFGHGVMGESVRELVEDKAHFLALNCQTNSNNHGFNLINRQYQRADSFSLDETEIKLAFSRQSMDYEEELRNLKRRMKSTYAWLTRGEVETIGMRTQSHVCKCPPFEVNVIDTIGAGDAFFSLASMAAALDLPVDMATFMGQLAGAQAVKIVGNATPVKRSTFVKGGMAMLSF